MLKEPAQLKDGCHEDSVSFLFVFFLIPHVTELDQLLHHNRSVCLVNDFD